MLFVEDELLEFENGWAIRIHQVKDGQVYYQTWQPNVVNQSIFAGLCRMPIADFEAGIASHPQK